MVIENGEPRLPVLLLHPKVIWYKERKNFFHWINERWFREKVFCKDTYVIDLDGNKWQIVDMILIRKSYDIIPLMFKSQRKYRHFKVRYIYGPPVQIKFEDLKSEIIARVSAKRWYRQLSLKEDEFRARINESKDMKELFYHAQFYGYAPPI